VAAKPLKELGAHPADQDPVNLHDGQYGPYVKHGKVSASIPKGRDPMSVTLSEAVELLAAKAGAPKRTVRGRTRARTRTS
jgi:DNA topoisomerase-1